MAPLSGSIRNTPENVKAFASTQVYAFVGTDDTIVKPEATRKFVSALIGAGYDAKLTELPETDHFGVPSQAYPGDYGLVNGYANGMVQGLASGLVNGTNDGLKNGLVNGAQK